MEDYLSSTNYIRNPQFEENGGLMFSDEAMDDHDDTCSKESGWDFLVDLIANNSEMDGISSFSLLSSGCRSSSSLVSDGASGTNTIVDEELEDTASSPFQSPKSFDLSCLYTKSQETTYRREDCQEKEHLSQKAGEVSIGFIDTELRKKGLCLVPLSMLLNLS